MAEVKKLIGTLGQALALLIGEDCPTSLDAVREYREKMVV